MLFDLIAVGIIAAGTALFGLGYTWGQHQDERPEPERPEPTSSVRVYPPAYDWEREQWR